MKCPISEIRLFGRFAPIFYFNCEHVLFVYIVKQKQTKNFKDFIKNIFVDFLNFQISNFVIGKFFENSIIHKPSLGGG